MSKNFDLEQYWSDMASILVHMKRFQKETINFRKILGIPVNGFPQDLSLLWYKSLFDQPNIDTKKRFSFESSHVFLPPNKFVIETIEQFAGKFNLDERWYVDLLFYLMSDKGTLDVPYGGIDIHVDINDRKLPQNQQVVTKLSIEINKDTAIKDVESIWETVQQYQSKMKTRVPTRRRDIVNTKTYIKIRELEDQGLPQSEIVKLLPGFSRKTASDVANLKKEMEERFNTQK
jgi:hypothetical protein